jgi:hypothetical protein
MWAALLQGITTAMEIRLRPDGLFHAVAGDQPIPTHDQIMRGELEALRGQVIGGLRHHGTSLPGAVLPELEGDKQSRRNLTIFCPQ